MTAASGSTITIGGFSGDVEYNYTQATDNMNGRSISYFSETTEEKMRPKAGDPFYPDFQKFVDYYGNSQYADQFITAALDGSDTSFVNGNALFASVDAASRAEAVEKGSQYLAIAMYVIRELEDYVVTCQAGCTVDCDPDNSLDEAVAFYTGSLEGTSTDGTGKGVLFYTLANKRCNNFKTCGENGDSIEGTAKVNMNIFKAFNKMKEDNAAKNCDAVKASKEEIVRQMMVPLIQGTLRYAYLTQTAFEKKGEIEGASFAAAVLPWIHSCDKGSAETIYNNMKTGQAGTAKLSDVKQAFENTYSCLGITCADVGGIYDGSDYMDGASPCTGTGGSSSANRMAIGFATIVSAVALTLAIAV